MASTHEEYTNQYVTKAFPAKKHYIKKSLIFKWSGVPWRPHKPYIPYYIPYIRYIEFIYFSPCQPRTCGPLGKAVGGKASKLYK